MPQVKFIYASAKDHVIGHQNKLCWHLKEDLALFKSKTLFQTVMMGSNTYDSLPESFKPLPNRKSIIVTSRGNEYRKAGMTTADPRKTLQHIKDDVWVIGGANLFKQLEDLCTEVHHTEIGLTVKGDTTYLFDVSGWDVDSTTDWQTSEAGIRYKVTVYKSPKKSESDIFELMI